MISFIPFSIRHKDYIKVNKINIRISNKLRNNILNVFNKYNMSDHFTGESVFTDIINELEKHYGKDKLKAYDENNNLFVTKNIEDIVLRSYPTYVLDSIELFYQLIN